MAKKSIDQIRVEILARLDIRAEYETMGVNFHGNPNPTGWIACNNPYKKDDHPSCGVNIGSGSHRGFLVAFNQNGSRGKPYAAWSLFQIAADFLPGMGGDHKKTFRHYADKTGVKFKSQKDSPPTKEIVKKFQGNLTPEIVEYLKTKRGLTDESIQKYEIGWSSSKSKKDGYNSFPVYDRDEGLVNIRRHNSKKKPKTINWSGYGDARLWGVDRLAKSSQGSIVALTEGEFDSMLVEQETGLVSVSPTNGCNAFQRSWVEEFYGRHVVLLWDCDQEGHLAVEKIILPAFHEAVITGKVLSIKVVWLFQDANKQQKDFTDYIVKAGGTGADVLKMIEKAAPHVYPSIAIEELPPDPDLFFDGNSFIPLNLVEYITDRHDIMFNGQSFFIYSTPKGVWECCLISNIERIIARSLARRVKKSYLADAIKVLETQAFKNEEELTQSRLLLNLKNGMFDLETGDLLPHDKKYMSRSQFQIDYDPDAQCPRFMKALEEWFPDDIGKADALQEFSGYCLYPGIFLEKCLFLFGGGANGKSKYLNALTSIMGPENITSLDPQIFADKFLLGTLRDKLLNISTEIETKTPLASNILKKVISGEYVQADQKYNRDPVIFKPIAKHIFSMNEAPVITDRTWGFERRIVVVKFTRRFSEADADIWLDEKIQKEISGVFNWMLDGLRRMSDSGKITETETMRKDKNAFMRVINPITSFIEEEMILDKNMTITKTRAYELYSKWCDDNGVRRLSAMRFYAQVLSDYFQLAEKHGEGNSPRYFDGIGELVKT